MQKNQLVSSVIAGVVLLSALSVFEGRTAQARRPVSLLDAKCVNSGLGNARRDRSSISIGKEIYSSRFYLGPGYRSAAITCKIKPDNRPKHTFQTLNLGFGMRDNNMNSPGVEVKVYVDGQQVESRTVAPAQQAELSVDISNATNVAIEAACSSPTQYCDRVYFFSADLQRQNVSQQKKN